MSHAIVDRIIERSRQANRCIILPEADDDRVVQAAGQVVAGKYCRLLLLGKPDKVNATAKQCGVNLDGVEIIDQMTDGSRGKYIDQLVEKRKSKGMTSDEADKLLARTMYYSAFMVADGRADGVVTGSASPTADTVRSGLFGVGLTKGNKTVSSCSVMCSQVQEIGVNGTVIFADTGVVPEPTVEQLADIAIAAAECCRNLLEVEPMVAMLSFSTKGSAYSPAVQKVIDATKIVQQRRPDLKVDGELQLDAAVMPDIGVRKAKGSPVAGRANTLVFPDLSCGNIAYKLVERFGRALALGPLLLGLAKPINDLSRGCSVEDIALIAAITAVQAG